MRSLSLSLSLSLLVSNNSNNNNNYYYHTATTTTTSTSTGINNSCTITKMTKLSLSERYYQRLHIDPTTLDNEPTLKKLQLLMEAHLLHIPFENIAQHGGRSCYTNNYSNNDAVQDYTSISNKDQQDSYKQRQIIDIETVATTVLDKNRGGFCLELNTLFAYWLQTELHYPIHFVSAYVARDDPTDTNTVIIDTNTNTDTGAEVKRYIKNKRKVFGDVETHIVPFCTTIDDNYQQQYMIDIAFGESCIDPLKYPSLNTIQMTSDNMISQFKRTSHTQYPYITSEQNNDQNDNVENNDNNNGEYVMLLWYLNNEWVPRLRWNYNDSIMMPTSESNHQKPVLQQVQHYQCMYDRAHDTNSGFTQKLIITKVSKTQKISFAGTKLKITGPPRFPIIPTISFCDQNDRTITNSIEQEQIQLQQLEQQNDPEIAIPVTVEYLDNDETIRQLLFDVFGIPICETLSMTFVSSKSSTANPLLWDQF